VAPLSNNFINKISSLSQQMLAMTLHAEVCTLKFSCMVMTDHAIPLIVFVSLGRNDEPRFCHRYLFLTEKHLYLSHWAIVCSTVSIFGTHHAQTFLQPSFLMMAITADFPVPSVALSSLVMMQRSYRNSTSTLSLALAVAAMAGQPLVGPVTMVLFTSLNTFTAKVDHGRFKYLRVN
jgi:hypothetical protein